MQCDSHSCPHSTCHTVQCSGTATTANTDPTSDENWTIGPPERTNPDDESDAEVKSSTFSETVTSDDLDETSDDHDLSHFGIEDEEDLTNDELNTTTETQATDSDQDARPGCRFHQ